MKGAVTPANYFYKILRGLLSQKKFALSNKIFFGDVFKMKKKNLFNASVAELREWKFEKLRQQMEKNKSTAMKMTSKEFLDKMDDLQITVHGKQFTFWDMYYVIKKFVEDVEVLDYYVEKITVCDDETIEFDIDSNETILKHIFSDMNNFAHKLQKEIYDMSEKYNVFLRVVEDCNHAAKTLLEESGEGKKND